MPQLVRIKATPDTERLGLAGKVGVSYGFTTPSATGIIPIGELEDDYAESIFFEDTGQQLWFAAQLIEDLDHDPSLEITLAGKRIFYTSTGQWEEVDPEKPNGES